MFPNRSKDDIVIPRRLVTNDADLSQTTWFVFFFVNDDDSLDEKRVCALFVLKTGKVRVKAYGFVRKKYYLKNLNGQPGALWAK